MKRTNGRIARRAGPAVAFVALAVALGLAFLPLDPGPLAALGASPRQAVSTQPSSDPGQGGEPVAALAAIDEPPPPPPPSSDGAADPAPPVPPDTSSGPPGEPSPTEAPVTPPEPASLPPGVVSVDGGTVELGDVTVTAPAGALDGPTRISTARETGLPDFDGEPPLKGFSLQAVATEANEAVGAFGTQVRMEVSIGDVDLTGIDPEDLSLAALEPDGAWRVLASSSSGETLRTWIDAPGTFAVVVYIPDREVRVAFAHESDAPVEGRHRIDPGDGLTVTVGVTPDATIRRARLVETVPAGWTVLDPGGGAWDEQLRELSWELGRARRQQGHVRSFVVRAPLDSPADGGPAFESRFAARLDYRGGSADGRDVTVLVSPPLVIEHWLLARIQDLTFEARYLPEDRPILDAQHFDAFRVRFQLRNADTVPVTLTPQLEFRVSEGGRYETVPENPELGTAFYVNREWTRPPGLHGLSELGPQSEDIDADEVRVRDTDEPDQEATPGDRSMGQNPAQPITLPPLSYTEVEFSVRVTMDAAYLTAYELRITDLGVPLPGAVTATVRLGPEPPLVLSPGQKQGVPVGGPRTRGAEAAVAADGLPSTASTGPRYALLVSVATQSILAAAVVGTHGPFSTIADQCAICHLSHTAENRNVLGKVAPQSTLCLTCHDGTGANSNVSAQYTDAAVPANSPAAREYYRHDALVTTSHTRAQLNEFGGVLARHSECGDCHNAHAANATGGTQTSSGWTASGRLAEISGVSVVNGAAGTSPTYTFRDGSTSLIDREYQLCFKCHSGFTTLPSNAGFTPSEYFLDKGVELNPANASYHPIEAAGKNTTQKMTDSLNGTSPYKQWAFTTASTVRCSNCHASYTKYNLTTPPAAGSDLPPHTSQYRGVLLQNYKDRVLKTSASAYAAADFALCYLCHGETPFRNETSTQTNYRFHGFHTFKLTGMGSGGTDIDTAGAGQGNAICAECHFRIHSTTYKDGAQTLTGTRLVNFAPNVLPSGSTRSWTSTGTGTGTCTLTCHGVSHSNWSY